MFARRHICLLLSAFTLFLCVSANVGGGKTHGGHEFGRYTQEKAETLKNLIQWHEYASSTFDLARAERKPLFLLLTAPSWCYWCQVYESTDYLFHPDVVSILNSHFIPVYIDADKRQDLTRQYLEGGWPSTTILAPNKQRLYGFSGPRPVANLLSNLEKLVDYMNSNPTLLSSSESSSTRYNYSRSSLEIPSVDDLQTVMTGYANSLVALYDTEYGGFGTGAKFPQARSLEFALEMFELNGGEWMSIVTHTLKQQLTTQQDILTGAYKLFDPVEGGFHRYGVNRNWTPPHYEKMLYDNARLLKTYTHLLLLEPQNVLAQEAVNKTFDFMVKHWWDSGVSTNDMKHGGFYACSDVSGEEAYYGRLDRPEHGATVDKTKFADWNGEAVASFVYLCDSMVDEKRRVKACEMVHTALDFWMSEISENGLPHYVRDVEPQLGSSQVERGVHGNLFDNAYMLLAFTLQSEKATSDDDRYRAAAVRIADYSLNELFDFFSGGFFERHSRDIDKYAYGDEIELSKLGEENAVIAYSLIKLSQLTKNNTYLAAAVTTVSNLLKDKMYLDEQYYLVKSAQVILESGLLAGLKPLETVLQRPAGWWFEKLRFTTDSVNDLTSKSVSTSAETVSPVTPYEPNNAGLSHLSESSLIVLVLICLLSGLLSFLSPCSLPILPLYLSQILDIKPKETRPSTAAAPQQQSAQSEAAQHSVSKEVIIRSVVFLLGLNFTFTGLGAASAAGGSMLRAYLVEYVSPILGSALIGLGVMTILGIGWGGLAMGPSMSESTTTVGSSQPVSTPNLPSSKPIVTLSRAFLLGVAFAFSWTPCVGPILTAVITLAAGTDSILRSMILLFSYGLGLSVPLVVFCLYFNSNRAIIRCLDAMNSLTLPPFSVFGFYIELQLMTVVTGGMYIGVGYLMLSDSFADTLQLLALFGSTEIQQFINWFENTLLDWLRPAHQ
eukprot:GILJ01013130.1.p1 GENE.GILJ01013130.1~~GILJ01013130.1.p1  ORF type:complete len:949 (+),score=135.84 GILJ01013130.1:44-2890(+)